MFRPEPKRRPKGLVTCAVVAVSMVLMCVSLSMREHNNSDMMVAVVRATRRDAPGAFAAPTAPVQMCGSPWGGLKLVPSWRWPDVEMATDVPPPRNAADECWCHDRNDVWMSPAESVLLSKYIDIHAGGNYVEWGSGGSTTSFAPRILTEGGRAFSIEHYKPWCDILRETPAMSCWLGGRGMEYLCVDPGAPMAALGFPEAYTIPPQRTKWYHNMFPWRWDLWGALFRVNSGCCDEFRPYVDAVDSVAPAMVNVGLVDGRFRVACALKLLGALDHNNHVVFVHDFFHHREFYRPILEYYDVLEYADSLIALHRKPGLVQADGGWELDGRYLPGYEAYLEDAR